MFTETTKLIIEGLAIVSQYYVIWKLSNNTMHGPCPRLSHIIAGASVLFAISPLSDTAVTNPYYYVIGYTILITYVLFLLYTLSSFVVYLLPNTIAPENKSRYRNNCFWIGLGSLLIVYSVFYTNNSLGYIIPWLAFHQVKGDLTGGLGQMTVGAMMQRIILIVVGLILLIGFIVVMVGRFIS